MEEEEEESRILGDISLETGLARRHSTGEGGALTLQTAVMREVKRIGKPELKPIIFPE